MVPSRLWMVVTTGSDFPIPQHPDYFSACLNNNIITINITLIIHIKTVPAKSNVFIMTDNNPDDG